jgi:F420-0:gamma-glutamyl ligase
VPTDDKSEKWELAKKEADWWLDPNESQYQCMLTVKGNWMFANAGIDESNAEGNHYSLWPKDPQESVNKMWRFIREHYGVKEVGVIMSDSKSMPLVWGVVGHGIAHCGFESLYSYINQPDLYGRLMVMERVSVPQSLVTVGTYVMGEGDEQTPIAMITDIPRINFMDHEPTKEELEMMKPSLTDDIYAPLLTKANWNKGGSGK